MPINFKLYLLCLSSVILVTSALFSLSSSIIHAQTANIWNIQRNTGTNDLDFYLTSNGQSGSSLQLKSSGSMRARSFYDLDDSTNTYFLNPNSNSNIKSLTIEQGIIGNLGIGTTTPNALLDVNGTAILGSSTQGGLRVVSMDANTVNLRPSISNGDITITDDSGQAARGITIANGGKLGIGTSTPTGHLESYSGGTGSPGLVVTKVSGPGSEQIVQFNADANNPAMIIDRNKTTTLYGNLIINGDTAIDGSNGSVSGPGWHRSYGNTGWYNGTFQGGWYMSDSTWVRSYNDKAVYTGGIMRSDTYMLAPKFVDSDSPSFFVDPLGSSFLLQLRLDQYPDYPGGMPMCADQSSKTIGRCNSSDIKIKENIRYFDQPILESISKLKPATFDLKDGSAKDLPGFIAQDVQEIFPNLVRDSDNDGLLEFSRDQLVPHAIKAIQELNEKNKQQKAKIEDLERRIEELEKER